jgi:hypothetical protein
VILALALGATALAIGVYLSFSGSLPAEIFSTVGFGQESQRNLDDPLKRDSDGDNLHDILETNSTYARQFGLSPFALDIIAKCYVTTEAASTANATSVLYRLADDLKNKIEFVNIDANDTGVNFHIDGECTMLPQEFNFTGARYYHPELEDIDSESIKDTSLGKYLDRIAEPLDQRVHLQIVFASFEAAHGEYGVTAFQNSANRQIIVAPAETEVSTTNSIGHILGHMLGLRHSDILGSVMSEPGGPVYFEDEWSALFEEKNKTNAVLFEK